MTFNLTSESQPAWTRLAGQGTVMLTEGETLKILTSSETEPIFKEKVPKGMVWKLTLSVFGTEESAP